RGTYSGRVIASTFQEECPSGSNLSTRPADIIARPALAGQRPGRRNGWGCRRKDRVESPSEEGAQIAVRRGQARISKEKLPAIDPADPASVLVLGTLEIHGQVHPQAARHPGPNPTLA